MSNGTEYDAILHSWSLCQRVNGVVMVGFVYMDSADRFKNVTTGRIEADPEECAEGRVIDTGRMRYLLAAPR